MNDLQVYGFENREIRVVMKDGEPWFVAKDVATALGYEWKGMSGTMPNIPQEWTGSERFRVRSESGIEQERELGIISEPGLYFFLGRSDKESVLPFQKWYSGEVLPSIRKTGFYAVEGWKEALLASIEKFVIAAVERAFEKRALPDPKEKAYRELSQFVEKYLVISGRQAHTALVEQAYDKYRSCASRVLTEQEFMLKIALDSHGCIKLRQRRAAWEFCGCLFQYREAALA